MGIKHYLEVDETIALEQERQGAAVRETQMETAFRSRVDEMESGLRGEIEREQKGLQVFLSDLVTRLEEVKNNQESSNVMLERITQDQIALEFKVETHDDQFRPLRSQDNRFHRLQTEGGESNHPLLPPVSWDSNF
ncbi:MAG: hypothetical protein AAGC74_03535 [Verrucomicrobiota bacterium]